MGNYRVSVLVLFLRVEWLVLMFCELVVEINGEILGIVVNGW